MPRLGHCLGAAALLSALHAALAQGPFTLRLLDATKYPLAQCLDGTQGGYYISRGSGSGVANVIAHTQGAGASRCLEARALVRVMRGGTRATRG